MNSFSLDSVINKGEIQLGRGNIISSKDILRNPGYYPIYSSSAKGTGEFGCYGNYMFDEEMITWSVDGGGRFFYRPKHKFSVTNVSGYMLVDEDVWDKRFVYYCLDLQHQKISFDYQTKAHPSVIRHLYELPEFPKPEQVKIADVLSTVDRAIELTEVLIAKQQRVKTGLMQDLLTKGIDEHGNLRSEETHEFKDSPLGRIPVEWEVGGGEDYVDKDAGIKPGPFGSSLTKDMYTNTGFRVYGQEQVIGGNLDNGDYYISKRKYIKMITFAVSAGDVLISLVGSIGHVLIVPDHYHPGVINPRLLRFRPNQDVCYPYFLRVILLSQPIRNQLDALATGGTMPVLSAGIIRSLSVVIVDKMEQERVGVILGQIEKYLSSHIKRLRKLCSLKTALMQDLLNGKVPVTPLLTEQEETGA